jgi:hypothetical protein
MKQFNSWPAGYGRGKAQAWAIDSGLQMKAEDNSREMAKVARMARARNNRVTGGESPTKCLCQGSSGLPLLLLCDFSRSCVNMLAIRGLTCVLLVDISCQRLSYICCTTDFSEVLTAFSTEGSSPRRDISTHLPLLSQPLHHGALGCPKSLQGLI